MLIFIYVLAKLQTIFIFWSTYSLLNMGEIGFNQKLLTLIFLYSGRKFLILVLCWNDLQMINIKHRVILIVSLLLSFEEFMFSLAQSSQFQFLKSYFIQAINAKVFLNWLIYFNQIIFLTMNSTNQYQQIILQNCIPSLLATFQMIKIQIYTENQKSYQFKLFEQFDYFQFRSKDIQQILIHWLRLNIHLISYMICLQKSYFLSGYLIQLFIFLLILKYKIWQSNSQNSDLDSAFFIFLNLASNINFDLRIGYTYKFYQKNLNKDFSFYDWQIIAQTILKAYVFIVFLMIILNQNQLEFYQAIFLVVFLIDISFQINIFNRFILQTYFHGPEYYLITNNQEEEYLIENQRNLKNLKYIGNYKLTPINIIILLCLFQQSQILQNFINFEERIFIQKNQKSQKVYLNRNFDISHFQQLAESEDLNIFIEQIDMLNRIDFKIVIQIIKIFLNQNIIIQIHYQSDFLNQNLQQQIYKINKFYKIQFLRIIYFIKAFYSNICPFLLVNPKFVIYDLYD
ncbi:transmembrane protein, putative (macronuclear) [Tetrahymena thermophila SB210]|uniref:Transmembrane protein, putative n=1 Tax=Tetrahymena thermophila (strain SB210) TaxID=312017 RepID=W7X622_TETTS|nr:transmembrane protein, putative [Tetrahymena thermophila SB210]EWS72842.1 transmembrane protein, putative [Tetrahymena thermophila SB210]|eukprot:XP_012654633.1 transmembrane protein, putative [Tetrahymena thermophila SB210]